MLPQDPARNAQVWIQLLEAIGKYPMLLQPDPDGKALNFSAIFKEAVSALGIRNLEQFKVQVIPDQAAMAGAQAGNLVPAGAMAGGPQPGMPTQNAPVA
jgi:energy-converting hydrogenase Eha subunit A